MTIRPIPMVWDGDSMQPLSHFMPICNKQYVVGERYVLLPHEDRSQRSHAHYFACIAEAWANLPERLAAQWATPEHLRKHALIRSGYCDKQTFVASSKAEALRLAAFMRPIDEYAIIEVEGSLVIRLTAQSQSKRAMGADRFQDSKQKVLDFCAEIVGVKPQTLASEAGRAA